MHRTGRVARGKGPQVTGLVCSSNLTIPRMAEFSAQTVIGDLDMPRAPLLVRYPRDATARVVRRLLLATDLSPASEPATERAISLAMEHDASLIVISVVDPRRLRLPGGPFLRRVDQERAEVIAGTQRIVARARAAGANATFLVWDGDPAESIVAAAESEAADMIVIGSHGRGRLGRFVLGSTSARVADEARCQVVIVPS
jgi:ubiquinone biosynthesis protein